MDKKRKMRQSSKSSKCQKSISQKSDGKQTLEDRLAKSDPEFLQFLKDEGSLDILTCDDELSASSSDESATGDSSTVGDQVALQANDDGNVVSDEAGCVRRDVTLNVVQRWSRCLATGQSLPVLLDVMQALTAALQQVGHTEDKPCKFKVAGSAEFNAVVRTCLENLIPALVRFLNLSQSKSTDQIAVSQSPQWKKIRVHVKSYMTDIIELLSVVGSVQTVHAMLKHILDLVIFYVPFPKLSKLLLNKIIVIWSESRDEQNRLVAFCVIHRLLLLCPTALLERAFKLLYTAYVRNSKFTSTTTLPFIQLMQRCMVEIGRMNVNITYQYAFVYIRQLTINLRNALTVNTKECTQAVYNWQYIHSVSLWVKMICTLHSESDSMHSLIYPLTQTIIGTIKLVPTTQYYPLRFRCLHELNVLSELTSTHIPVLPFLTEVLTHVDFQQKIHANSMKSLNMLCILKLSKSQLNTKPYRDAVVDQTHSLMFEYFYIHAHTIGFPELVLPALIDLRKFVKTCKIASYTRRMKDLIGKLVETTNVITERRQKAAINLRDVNAVAAWETSSRKAGTPISKFYLTWKKLRLQQLEADLAVDASGHGDTGKQSRIAESVKVTKSSAATRRSDFDDEELAMLARSASEGDDSGEDDDDDDDCVNDRADNLTSADNKSTGKRARTDSDDDDDDVIENMSLTESECDDTDVD